MTGLLTKKDYIVNAMTENEELEAACQALGRKLEDIKVYDDRNPKNGFCLAPAALRFQATWGDPDLDCLTGSGPTPQAACWELVDYTDGRSA